MRKLLKNTKNKLIEKNGENVSHLEITNVVLVHWNTVSTDY